VILIWYSTRGVSWGLARVSSCKSILGLEDALLVSNKTCGDFQVEHTERIVWKNLIFFVLEYFFIIFYCFDVPLLRINFNK